MNKKILKILVSCLTIGSFALAFPVMASEITGNLNTGLGNNVDGTVISAPIANPVAGTYTSTQSVALSANGNQSIRYTTDGSAPTCSSGSIYSNPIAVNSSETIKAIACYPNSVASQVSSFSYVINLQINSSQLPSLLDNGTLTIPEGSTEDSTPSLDTTQNVVINVPDDGGTSSVTLDAGTVITNVNGNNFNANDLTAATVNAGSLSGLGTGVVVDGALQWGIANLGLQFSQPIDISIFVGNSFNGQTLNISRSTSGNSGWTSDGIVSPATCVVSSGYCSFNANKASYYVVTETASQQPNAPSGGGGGGGTMTSSIITPSNPSISIDGNAQKTNSLNVNLTLGATNAIQMAIANTADFAGVGWETYAAGKTWNLTEGAGVKTVFVKFRASSGAVSSVVSDTISYEPDVTINDQQGEVLGASTYNFDLYSLYQANGSPDVYAVINDVKRKIRSLEIFNSYNWAGGKIKPTTQGYLDSLPDANLIKTPDSPNVYILEKGFKRLLASVEIFDSYALNWNRIATINQAEMDSYANAPLIKHGPDLLWLDGNRIGHLFPSMESLTRHGYNTRDAIDINDLEFSSIGIGIEINN